MRRVTFIAALTLFGCGSGPDDPGSGTGTLLVRATGVIEADFTDVALELTARGVPVIDATVRLRDGESGAEATAELRDPGFYVGRLPGPARVLRLDIEAGEDALEAGIGGPEAFAITRPPEGALVRGGDAERLLLAWTAPDEEPIDAIELTVVGSDDLPRSTARLEGEATEGRVELPGEPGLYRAEVTRIDVVRLAGGTEGSELRLERSARVGFELAP